MTDTLPNGVVGSYPRELGSRRGNQSDPWIPTSGTGEGDHIAARSLGGSTGRQRLVMGREAGGSRYIRALKVPAFGYAKVCVRRSGQVPRTTLGSGPGPQKLRAHPPTYPCIEPLSTLLNDKATREFCFRRAPRVSKCTVKEGALRAGLCCRRGGALSTKPDPQLYVSLRMEVSLGAFALQQY